MIISRQINRQRMIMQTATISMRAEQNRISTNLVGVSLLYQHLTQQHNSPEREFCVAQGDHHGTFPSIRSFPFSTPNHRVASPRECSWPRSIGVVSPRAPSPHAVCDVMCALFPLFPHHSALLTISRGNVHLSRPCSCMHGVCWTVLYGPCMPQ